MNFDRVENHIYLPTVVTVQTTKAFRKPFVINPFEELVEGGLDACESLAAFRTYQAKVVDASGVRMAEVAEVSLHCRPHTDAAYNLTVIEPAPFINGIGVLASERNEQVSFEIDWHASSITLTQGVLIGSRRMVDEYQFSFSFSQVIRD